jgi:hypothetical protein
MKGIPLSIKLIVLLGIVVAVQRFYEGIIFNRALFLFDGACILILSIGLFRRSNFAQFAIILFSLYFIALYIFLFILCVLHNIHYSWGINLVTNFPALIWTILALIISKLKIT